MFVVTPWRLWLVPLCLALLSGEAAADKPSRMLGIKVNLGAAGDFDASFVQALRLGNETQVVPLDWNELETAPERYRPKTNFLAIANGYYAARRMPIHLSLRPLHTTRKVVPDDLQDQPLDDPHTIARFRKLLDWVATQLPDVRLVSIAIGSEIDVALWGNDRRWSEWTKFYAAAAEYARERFPGTLIATETTFHAFTGADRKRMLQVHRHSDAIGVSYYPMRSELRAVQSPDVVRDDFATVVKSVEDKPIIFYQIGYPSSEVLASSPQQQAAFVSAAFSAWDSHAQRIFMLNFQWMHEAPPHGVEHYVDYYRFDSPAFRAFLGSLGLKSWTGVAKPAWHALEHEALSRGFGLR